MAGPGRTLPPGTTRGDPRVATPLMLFAALVGASVTLASLVLPGEVSREPTLLVAVEISAGLVVLLVAYLAWGRFRHDRQVSDLALTLAASLLAGSNLLYSAPPIITHSSQPGWLTWTTVTTFLLAGTLLAAAAFVPDRKVPTVRRGLRQLGVGWLLGMGLVALLGHIATPWRPLSVYGTRDLLEAPALLLTGHAAGMVLYVAAAIGYWRRVQLTGDAVLAWFGAGMLFAAFAQLNHMLLPGTHQTWLYTGDLLWLGFYLLLLVGAAREITAYWQDRAAAAVLEERRRLARDLHDGLAQELAYIAAQSRLAISCPDTLAISTVSSAAERALDESRRAIAALARPDGESFEVTVVREAEEVAIRTGTSVRFMLDASLQVRQALQEAVLRITREGVANAGRHGRAATVLVELRCDRGLLLRIRDDGHGFDPSEASGRGFGLVSMRERAEALGGTFQVHSSPGRGATVEVVWPNR